jgi:cell division protein FtsQ
MNSLAKTAIRTETDFLRKRNNDHIHKQKRIHFIQVKGFHILLVLLLVAGAAFAAYKIGSFLLTWEKLNVKTYVLLNKPTYNAAKAEAVIKRFRGNILTISFSDMREKLLAINEVKDVYLSRKLPSTVEVKFLLRKPVFQVAINGKYNIIDMEGVVVHTSNQSRPEFIQIRDVNTNQLETLAPYLEELSRIRDSVDYISLRKPYGVTLKLKGQKEIFYPGESDYAYKINYYLKLRKRPLLRGYDIKSVDLRFKDRFYFEYQTHDGG